MYLNRIFAIALLALMTFGCSDVAEDLITHSPDQSLAFKVGINAGRLTYEVFADEQLVMSGRMGVQRENADFSNGLRWLRSIESAYAEQHYVLYSGKQREIETAYNTSQIVVLNGEGQVLKVAIRVYDEGVAFRYLLPGKESVLEADFTTYAPANGIRKWAQAYDEVTKWTPAYERFFEADTIGVPSPTRNGWAFPMLIESTQHWLMLTEAGNPGNYSGLHLRTSTEGAYQTALPVKEEANGHYDHHPEEGMGYWKVIMIERSLADIVNNSMVTHLPTKPAERDWSWVKPGRVAWSWLTAHDSPKDYEAMKAYVDMAAALGWEYVLVDANWDQMQGGELPKLIQYAKNKQVAALVWYNSGGVHNSISEAPRNLMDDAVNRKKTFAWLREIGAAGVKIDFFQSDKAQLMVNYRDILEDAAEYQLLINFHGCTIPRGWRKTYPHLLAMESVKGAEAYTFDKTYAQKAPTQNTILPFTRNVIGPMDYTPVLLNETMDRQTTKAHELALAVLFESGLQHFADGPSAYLDLESPVKNYFKSLPVVWDEVKLIAGYPGEWVVLARRHGDDWYIAGINGTDQPLEIAANFSWVHEKRVGSQITDGEHGGFAFEQKTLYPNKPYHITLQPFGGFVLTLNH